MTFQQFNFCALLLYTLAPQGIFYIYVLQITEHMFQFPTLIFPQTHSQWTASVLSRASCSELWKCAFTEEPFGTHRRRYQNFEFSTQVPLKSEGKQEKNLFHRDFISHSLMNVKQTWPINGLILALPPCVWKCTHTDTQGWEDRRVGQSIQPVTTERHLSARHYVRKRKSKYSNSTCNFI